MVGVVEAATATTTTLINSFIRTKVMEHTCRLRLGAATDPFQINQSVNTLKTKFSVAYVHTYSLQN